MAASSPNGAGPVIVVRGLRRSYGAYLVRPAGHPGLLRPTALTYSSISGAIRSALAR
jgi:hypothetical protein